MIKYSIHTLELHAQVTPNDYDYFYSVLSTMGLSITKNEYITINPLGNDRIMHKLYVYRHFTNYDGINNISLITTKTACSRSYCIQVCMNPYNALYKCRHSNADIIEEGKIEEAMGMIQTHLHNLFPRFPIAAYSLKRLDFCLDIKFPTQKQADEYIKLLKKSIPRKVLKEKTHFDQTQHRRIPYGDSLLLACKSYSFEAYPKYRQMIKRKKKTLTPDWGLPV